MSYYKILGFEKEPFSTSPDPDFLYMSQEHESALTNALIELNLQRGLNVILGDVGTGKTTLSRKLVQELGKRERFLYQIILNPYFEDEKHLMHCLMENFEMPVEANPQQSALFKLRDSFEKFLLEKTIKEHKIVILIIDEAQKLSKESMETLRILLNYETNEFKLLQILLLGQMELYPKISEIDNFFDRINFKFSLYPFCFEDTREMIHFRIKQAGYKGKTHLFLDDAVREIYANTGGYPRRITLLCHKALKRLILENKYVVDRPLIRSIVEAEEKLGWKQKALPQNSSYCV